MSTEATDGCWYCGGELEDVGHGFRHCAECDEVFAPEVDEDEDVPFDSYGKHRTRMRKYDD